MSITAKAAPFPRANIDTDAIIPVTFLRAPSKDVSRGLFYHWRYDEKGDERPEYILNQLRYRDANIIVGGPNFGCGSSRESAVWAFTYSGIKCVISSSFGDIFYENSFKNGLLAAIVSEDDAQELLDDLQSALDPLLTVDLRTCEIRRTGKASINFTIPTSRRDALMKGLDEISLSLTFEPNLTEYKASDRLRRPWVYALERS